MRDGVYEGFTEAGLPVRAGMGFREFCEIACAHSDAVTDKHLRSQASFLFRDRQLIVQQIGRVEHLEQDWSAMQPLSRHAAAPLHLNRTRHGHSSRYYEDGALDILVGDRYAMDVKAFDYDFRRA